MSNNQSDAGRASRNAWVKRNFPGHYDRIATKVHGPPSSDPKTAFLVRQSGRKVSNEALKADKELMQAIADRRRGMRREQQRKRNAAKKKARPRQVE